MRTYKKTGVVALAAVCCGITLGSAVTLAEDSAPARAEPSRAAPARAMPARPAMSTRQMMIKLAPRPKMGMVKPAAPASGSPAAGTSIQNKPQEPPKYEIADCGTNASPMVCCHHEAGDGSTCNMFKMLCENAGGTAQGDGTDATCSDW